MTTFVDVIHNYLHNMRWLWQQDNQNSTAVAQLLREKKITVKKKTLEQRATEYDLLLAALEQLYWQLTHSLRPLMRQRYDGMGQTFCACYSLTHHERSSLAGATDYSKFIMQLTLSAVESGQKDPLHNKIFRLVADYAFQMSMLWTASDDSQDALKSRTMTSQPMFGTTLNHLLLPKLKALELNVNYLKTATVQHERFVASLKHRCIPSTPASADVAVHESQGRDRQELLSTIFADEASLSDFLSKDSNHKTPAQQLHALVIDCGDDLLLQERLFLRLSIFFKRAFTPAQNSSLKKTLLQRDTLAFLLTGLSRQKNSLATKFLRESLGLIFADQRLLSHFFPTVDSIELCVKNIRAIYAIDKVEASLIHDCSLALLLVKARYLTQIPVTSMPSIASMQVIPIKACEQTLVLACDSRAFSL